MFDLPYKLERACCVKMEADQPPEVIGATPVGFRINGFISRGEVSGPRIRGIVRTIGCGDWATVRSDDVLDLDVRLTIESHDGALIYVTYTGIGSLGEGGTEKMLNGKLSAPIVFRIESRMLTAHPQYLGVNRTQFMGIGEAHIGSPTRIKYEFYAVE